MNYELQKTYVFSVLVLLLIPSLSLAMDNDIGYFSNKSVLIEAIDENDEAKVQKTLQERPNLINESFRNESCYTLVCRQTPLDRATPFGKLTIVQLLMAAGADPLGHDQNMSTPLMNAVSNIEHVQCIIQGAEQRSLSMGRSFQRLYMNTLLHAKNKYGENVFSIAERDVRSFNRDSQILEYLKAKQNEYSWSLPTTYKQN